METTEIKVIFDGQTALDEEKGVRYPVNGNYAGKTKLVPGDILYLTLGDAGLFFKLISSAPRKTAIAELAFLEGRLCAVVDGFALRVLTCVISFFKAKEGDRVIIIYNPNIMTFCAIEGKIELL